MKVAFVGKGGSGKTTLSSLFVRHLAAQGLPVVAVDADINQHLAEALGAAVQPPPLGAHLAQIKEHLRGTNPRIASPRRWSRPPRPAAGPGCCGPAAPIRSTIWRWTRRPGRRCWRPGRSVTMTWAWPATTPRPARSSCTSTTSSTVPASTWWSTARPARPGRELGQRRHLGPGQPRLHPPGPGQEPDQLVIGQPGQPRPALPRHRVQHHRQQRTRRHDVSAAVLSEPLQGQALNRRGLVVIEYNFVIMSVTANTSGRVAREVGR